MKKWHYFALAAMLFIVGVTSIYVVALASMVHNSDEWDALGVSVKAAWASGGVISILVAPVCFVMAGAAILDGLEE